MHRYNGLLIYCGILFTGVTVLIPSMLFAARESRPFWTEKTAFVEGDDLFVVGVASKARTAEAGRQQAFEHGKIELMNYAQVTSLEAQGLVIETQMTHEESNPDSTVTVYRLLRVPAAKLVAIQGRLQTESRAQEQALEQARRELVTIQQSLSEKAQKLDQQQRQVEQLLQQLTTKLQLSGPSAKGTRTTASLAEALKQAEAQMGAQEDELLRISQRARERILEENQAFRRKCRHLVIGMTAEEVEAIMGQPSRKVEAFIGLNVGLTWYYTGRSYTLWLDIPRGGGLRSIGYEGPSAGLVQGCP